MHHNSIRKYTAALLDLFNNVSIEYRLSNNQLVKKNVPIEFTSKEKSRIIDKVTSEQLLEGNYNVLPKANLSLNGLQKMPDRTLNKNLKINNIKTDDNMEFMYNSVPYEFSYDVTFQCRGMTEATQIIEQLAPKFNPIIDLDIWDVQNLSSPTRIPVKLLDIQLETEEFTNLSSNIVTVVFSLSLSGNLYQPLKKMPRVKEFQIYLNEVKNSEEAQRVTMIGWDSV